jgi:hypothetical protein
VDAPCPYYVRIRVTKLIFTEQVTWVIARKNRQINVYDLGGLNIVRRVGNVNTSASLRRISWEMDCELDRARNRTIA